MSDREQLADMIRTDRGDMNVYSEPEVRKALDAYRAEVRNEQGYDDQETLEEAALMYRSLRDAIVRTMPDPSEWDGDGDEGSILANYVVWLAAGQPDEDADFFQRGHTYTHSRWQFRCDHISLHPATGERRALGWLCTFTGQWQEDSLDPDDWASGNWTDTTDTTMGDPV